MADGNGGDVVERAGRRHGARNLLGVRVAAYRGAERLTGTAPAGLGPFDVRGRHGAARLGHRRAKGGGVAYGGPRRHRTTAAGRLRVDGAARTRVGGAGAA